MDCQVFTISSFIRTKHSSEVSFFFKRDGILHQAKKEFIRRSKPDLRVAVPSFVFGLNLFRGIE